MLRSSSRAALHTVLAITSAASLAVAAPVSAPPKEVGGELRPASPPDELWRDIVDALLFLPRSLVQAVVLASNATTSFFEDQQIIPRAREILGSRDGTILVAPTVALASGLRPDLGARMTSAEGPFASMLRGSIVDRDTYLLESRLLLSLGDQGRTQLVLEGFHQRRTDNGFLGLGPDPANDPRNAFLPGHLGTAALFLETRERIIASVGRRTSEDVEILLSSSFQRRKITDTRGDPEHGIDHTFVSGTVAGAYDKSERFYTEAAVRRDTRALRGPPSPGLLLEAYGGASQDARGTYASALHGGGRVAWFVPIVRPTTILNPRLTLDVVEPVGDGELPFREYSYASGFRGGDGRVDRVAALASVDYRWQLVSYVAARLFGDVTTVAPKVKSLRLDHLAWAVGGGIDLHSSTTEIGRIGVVYSASTISLLLTFGLSGPGFGDRQHR